MIDDAESAKSLLYHAGTTLEPLSGKVVLDPPTHPERVWGSEPATAAELLKRFTVFLAAFEAEAYRAGAHCRHRNGDTCHHAHAIDKTRNILLDHVRGLREMSAAPAGIVATLDEMGKSYDLAASHIGPPHQQRYQRYAAAIRWARAAFPVDAPEGPNG